MTRLQSTETKPHLSPYYGGAAGKSHSLTKARLESRKGQGQRPSIEMVAVYVLPAGVDNNHGKFGRSDVIVRGLWTTQCLIMRALGCSEVFPDGASKTQHKQMMFRNIIRRLPVGDY